MHVLLYKSIAISAAVLNTLCSLELILCCTLHGNFVLYTVAYLGAILLIQTHIIPSWLLCPHHTPFTFHIVVVVTCACDREYIIYTNIGVPPVTSWSHPMCVSLSLFLSLHSPLHLQPA